MHFRTMLWTIFVRFEIFLFSFAVCTNDFSSIWDVAEIVLRVWDVFDFMLVSTASISQFSLQINFPDVFSCLILFKEHFVRSKFILWSNRHFPQELHCGHCKNSGIVQLVDVTIIVEVQVPHDAEASIGVHGLSFFLQIVFLLLLT